MADVYEANQKRLAECVKRLREILGRPENEPFRLYLEGLLEDVKTRLCRESDSRQIYLDQGEAQVLMTLIKDLYPKN